METNQASDLDQLIDWANSQGNVGIAVLLRRAVASGGCVTPNLVAQARKVRDRQIADGKLTPAPTAFVPVTERITRRPPVVETTQSARFVRQDESILAPAPAPASKRANPWPGTYTLQHEGGHTTFRVKIQPSDAEFAPGSTLIELLVGQDNENDYSTFGFLREGRVFPFKGFRSHEVLLERASEFLRDPEGDNVLVSKRCARCNRKLTTPESVAAGFGPDCIEMGLR